MSKVNYETITIYAGVHCLDCGWPIIHVCCNGSFCYFKDAAKFDYWVYCSNKICNNHDGIGVYQKIPGLIVNN